jgi:hypothetical protein
VRVERKVVSNVGQIEHMGSECIVMSHGSGASDDEALTRGRCRVVVLALLPSDT